MPTRSDLHAYQERAVKFMRDNPKCALMLDLGLGKTIATLTGVQDLLSEFEAFRVLVVAPLRVTDNTWPAELDAWDHLDLDYQRLRVKRRRLTKKPPHKYEITTNYEPGHQLYLVNIDVLIYLVDHFRKGWPFDMVILDESSLFKNYDSQRFKRMKRVLPSINRLVLLTGTPAPNGLLDLWPQIFLLDNGQRLFRTITGYRNHYFESDYMGYNWTPRAGSEEDIYGRVADLCLRLDADDYLELPERIDNRVVVEIPERRMAEYRKLEKDSLLALTEDDTVVAGSAGVLVGKLLQFANGALYVHDEHGKRTRWEAVHDAKLKALEEIHDTAGGQPLLVAYYYQSDLERLQAKFPDAVVLDQDTATVEAWNRGEIDMLLAHPQAAGHGLNLQHGGSLLVWFSLTWSLEHYQQFNARLHRQGQTNTVVVHHIVAAGTVDEDVLAALGDKGATQGRLLEALKRKAEALGDINDRR